MKAQIRNVEDHGTHYEALAFWCPGCERVDSDGRIHGGLHMLPVNTTEHSPSWTWDGNLEEPTLSPSILTRIDFSPPFICHSFLRNGVFEFLGDCTHQYAGQNVPMSELPDWFVNSWQEEDDE